MKFNGFGGGAGGMGNMQQMMKQAQKMQEQMKQAQAELDAAQVTGSAGGMVNVVLSGHKKMLAIGIKPEACDPEDIEMLEDLIMAAYNDAFDKADELYKEKMGPLSALGI